MTAILRFTSLKVFLLSLFASYCMATEKPPENVYLPTKNFRSNFPYISGETVRASCDHILDPTISFDPTKVHCGDTIFVMYDYLSYFFETYHPHIPEPYILVTHHFFDSSDDPSPGLANLAVYLDDEKIIGWFTHNIDRKHPKLHPLPIGIASPVYSFGRKNLFDVMIRRFVSNIPKNSLLYMNFSINTYPKERQFVYDLFKNAQYCTKAEQIELRDYLIDLARHKFVLSPRGNGLDCYRTWEALLMKCYPIVMSSTLDSLFEDLPVLIIQNWTEINQEFLERKYTELSGRNYNWEKLYMPYWIKQMQNLKREYIQKYSLN